MAGISITLGGNFAALNQLQAKVKETAAKIKQGFTERIGHRMFDGLRAGLARIPAESWAAIQAASDLGETVAKVGEVFRKEGESILGWAENSASGFGQSRTEALAAASDFGNLIRAMGMTDHQAGAMSKRLVELAADLASFNNTSVPDAVTAIGAALRGESEPIRRYGVLLTDATLKAEAMSQGLYKGKGTLDPASRALAAYNLILGQTTTAHGDFARTSDGLANSQRILAAQLGNMQAATGEGLLPAMERLAGIAKQIDGQALGEQFGSWGNEFSKSLGTALRAAEAYMNSGYANMFTGGWSGSVAKGWRSVFDVGVISTAEKKSNALLQEFNPQNIAGTVASREELAAVLQKLIEKKAEFEESIAGTMTGQSAEVQGALQSTLEGTGRVLDLHATRLKKITNEQLAANKATRDAAAEQARVAKAVEEAGKAYEKARDAFDKNMKEAGRKRIEALPLRDQLAEIDAAAEKIRKGLPLGLRNPYAGAEELAGLIEKFRQTGSSDPALGTAMEDVQKLAEVELRRDDILAKIREENEARLDVIQDYEAELGILRAQVEGNREKVSQLEREVAIRQKIADLVQAGVNPVEAQRRAEALVSAQADLKRKNALDGARDILDEARAVAGGAAAEMEYRIGRRARELADAGGVTGGEALNIARNEADLEKLTDLRNRRDNMTYESNVAATSSMQRIGGGGGAYTAGLEYARRQTDLLRRIDDKLGSIDEKTRAPALDY